MFFKKSILRLKEVTVFELLRFFFCLFIFHAIIDISIKVTEHRQYDMERILTDIKVKYPKSTLTFQNIRIEGNDLKQSSYPDDALYYDTYFEKTNVYIRGNRLHKEPNYLWVLHGLAPLLFLIIFHQDIRSLKLKDLNKVSYHTCAWIFGSIILSMIIEFTAEDDYYFKKYASPDEFTYETKALLNEIDLSKYKTNH